MVYFNLKDKKSVGIDNVFSSSSEKYGLDSAQCSCSVGANFYNYDSLTMKE